MKTYTLEIYHPVVYSKNPMQQGPRVRVHVGAFEENRDNLSPCMIRTKEVRQHKISGARARAKEFFAEYKRRELK